MLQLGIAERPKLGQSISGDSYFVTNGGPQALIAVIDGLGGGAAACEAAQLARAAIVETADRPLAQIMSAAHQACVGTRGAVVGLLRLDLVQHHASYVGVGNIGIHVVSKHAIKPISRNGIVGYRLPTTLHEQHATYDPGDTFILFSDGVSARFSESLGSHEHNPPQEIADYLMASYGKEIDDVTVVVVRTSADVAQPEMDGQAS